MDDMSELQAEIAELGARSLRERQRREIERAIDRVKRPMTGWDRRFRREWYRATSRQGLLTAKRDQECEECRAAMKQAAAIVRPNRWEYTSGE